MTTYSLTVRSAHLAELRRHLIRQDGNEHAAYLLCSSALSRRDPWDREAHRKFLCTKVIPVPDDQIIEQTPNLACSERSGGNRTNRGGRAQSPARIYRIFKTG